MIMSQGKSNIFSSLSTILQAAVVTLVVLLSLSPSHASEDDPLEPMNRVIFGFNEVIDDNILEPVAEGYRFITPDPVENSVSNFFNNLGEINTIVNSALQMKPDKTISSTSRFVINSSVGILGLFDPAENLGLIRLEKEDYGQSFGKMGIGEGCYLVLPVLGPSTVRDATASVASFVGGDAWYNVTVANDTQHFSDFDYYASRVTSGIDFRAKNYDAIENLEKNSIDFYASVKSLYLQDRQQKILNTNKIIETQDDSDWEEIETQ